MIKKSEGPNNKSSQIETYLILKYISSDDLKNEYFILIENKKNKNYVPGGSILYQKYKSLKK